VRTNLLLAAVLAMAGVPPAHGADQSDVKRVLDRFHAVRPQAASLSLYQLDWLPTLKAAKEKAAKENRPIFLVVVTNSFGDLYTGHC
jgi:hypothetical protein